MLTEVFPTVENACSYKEGSSSMDPNCVVEEISDSLQSCEPFSATENDPCRSLVSPLGTEDLVGAFNSVNIAETSEQRDDEGNDVKLDTSEMKSANSICSSPPRRSAHMTKSNQKTQTRKAARKGGKTVVKKALLDSVLLGVGRKRRSYLCKPARSSVWGALGHIVQCFEQNPGVVVNQNEDLKSRKERGARGSGKRKKNQAGASSQRVKEKNCVSSGRIRLKVKIGKEMGHSCLKNRVDFTDDGLGNYRETSTEGPILDSGSQIMLKEKVPAITGFQCCNGDPVKVETFTDCSHNNICLADKDLESPVIREMLAGVTAENHETVTSQIELEGLGVADDKRYFDTGTSPDSEVINLTPESQVNGKVQEDLHDTLIFSSTCVASGDMTSLDLPQMSSEKGKEKYTLPHASNLSVEGRLRSPEIISKTGVLEKLGQEEKMGDGAYSSEASISTTTAKMSGTTSSSEGFVAEPFPSSRITDSGVSCNNLRVESGIDQDLSFSLGVGLESPESGISKNLIPYGEAEGKKHLKSSKSRRESRSGLEGSSSPRNRRGNSFRQKGKPVKSVTMRKVKDKGDCDDFIPQVENHPESDRGKSETGNGSTTKNIFNLEMVPRGAGEQYLLQRNAWVCCDDCFKWRRIAATLADSIEETNCRWTCKDNLDKSFADCSIPQEKSNAEINAELEISDGSGEEDASGSRLNSKRLESAHASVFQQSTWKLIKSNLFLHRSRKSQTIDEVMVCHCKPPTNGKTGCGDGCLNRMLNIECVQGTCPCGESCSNQQFQKGKYAKLKWFRCGKKGFGLQLLEDISEGQFLIEYVGEVLDMQAYEARQREYASKGHKHFYFMTLNGSEVIDACAKGNLGRFINHSCDPNCRTEKWMVNGEVCIGLFALRDIKKGEEVTFDYNYVRVFGAAAKKCVCGTSQCRGYIGGDPSNTEVIVQGDSDEEFPEPLMVYEDGVADDKLKSSSSFDGIEMQIANNSLGKSTEMKKSATSSGHLKTTIEIQVEDKLVKDEGESDPVQQLETTTQNSINKSALSPSVQQVENASELEYMSKTISSDQQEFVQTLETSSLSVISSNLLSDKVDTKNKCRTDTFDDRRSTKSRPIMKTSRSSSSVKKEKLKSNSVNVNKPEMMVSKAHLVSHKPKKIIDGSLTGRFEAVEEKLNELLDAEGGISKRKDATRSYLKLLLLTAASGDSGNGEAIQSNRDLSMILDALLKTKSRMVLADVINKNGLQMLHNIMKRYRRDFNKIPILRKLLKVLEYLAVREILTFEQINGGPPCPGVESFRESILTLTEHDDKQVHQIARNFRDRWIPRPARKSRVEFHRGVNCNRFSASQNHLHDQGIKNTEAVSCVQQPIVAANTVDTGTVESSSASCNNGCPTSVTKPRKRKSRWDQPAEVNTDVRSPDRKEAKVQPILLQKSHSGPHPETGKVFDQINGINREDNHSSGCLRNISQQMENGTGGRHDIDEDVPPGFSLLNAPSVPSNASSTFTDIRAENGVSAKCPSEVVMGHPHGRFNNRLSVSYGIPLPVVQQFGTPQAGTLESWVVAPGVPFHPFPPLPPYPRDKREPPPCAGNSVTKNPAKKGEQDSQNPALFHSEQSTPSTSGASPPESGIQGANIQHTFQEDKAPYRLGRRYFRQQKWNNSKSGPPWKHRKRYSWGATGNPNSRNGMRSIGVPMVLANEIKGPNSTQDVNTGAESACYTYHQYPQQQNYH